MQLQSFRNFISSLSASVCLLLLLVIAFFISVNLAHAQSSAGVSISPAVIEETVDPGVSKDYIVTIENLTNEEVVYYLFPLNISGVKDGGVPIFADNNNEVTGYELADWINLSETVVTIPPLSKKPVSFIMNVPDNAAPGSHFGGVFVSVEPPEIQNSGAAVGYQVANIISLRVTGEVTEDASIRQFSTNKFLYGSQNVDFLARIENKGNVLVRPIGPLEIHNMLGNVVGTITFNEGKAAVFPYDTREFSNVTWKGDSVGFGRYEAILSLSYGDTGAKKTMSSTVTFWILPMSIIGPAAGVLAVIILVTFVFVKLYIKRSLEHLNHGRRLVRRKKSGSSTVLLVTIIVLTAGALFLIVLLALFA